MSLALSNPVADEAAARTIVSLDGGTSWAAGTQLSHLNLLAAASADNTTRPMAVTRFDADVALYTRIARADGLTLTDEAPPRRARDRRGALPVTPAPPVCLSFPGALPA
ncbi:hypothetical protein AAHB44_06475 [Pseudomonas simiae]